jgi:hypothetical protein
LRDEYAEQSLEQLAAEPAITRTEAREQSTRKTLTSHLSTICCDSVIMQLMHDRLADTLDHPRTLLPTTEQTDFSRNLFELEKRARRPYSLTSVLRAMCETPHKLGALEMEVDQELRALNPRRGVIGHLVPIEALSQPWRRDLSITTPSTGSVTVQTSVGDEVIPFLRAKTVCGRLGATLLDGLTNGNVKLPRCTVGGVASWLPEIGPWGRR